MTSRVFAVDLGTWSVKLAVASPGIRGATLLQIAERRVPPGDEPYALRAQQAVKAMLDDLGLRGDSGYISAPGDAVFAQVLEFGFKNLRRADLDTAVGGELENVVPVDLEDMVYCFEPIPSPPTPKTVTTETSEQGKSAAISRATSEDGGKTSAGDAVRGRQAPPPEGMRVLSYAMRRDRAEQLIELARQTGFDPRGILVCAGGAAKLVDKLPSLSKVRSEGPVAVVDIGHERTDIVVVQQGKPVFSRSLARGGKHVSEAIAKFWRLDFQQAEAAKHADGFIASTAEPASNEAWARIHNVVVQELSPLARDVRHTFAACRARTGYAPVAAILTGGGARLRGLGSFLTEQLAVPAWQLTPDDVGALVGPKVVTSASNASVDATAMTIGMAFDCAGGRPQFDLRSGALAVKVDLSFLRAKAASFGAALLTMAALAAGSAYANLYRLRKAEHTLTARVASETKEVFKVSKSVDAVVADSGPAEAGVQSPMPKMSAYDILLEISSHIPAKDKVTIDIDRLEIDSQKIEMSGSAKTVDEIQLLVTELKKVECFNKKVNQGPTETDSNGAKKFRLTIDAECM